MNMLAPFSRYSYDFGRGPHEPHPQLPTASWLNGLPEEFRQYVMPYPHYWQGTNLVRLTVV